MVTNTSGIVKTTNEHSRDLAEILDVAPMTLDNLYNIIEFSVNWVRSNAAAIGKALGERAIGTGASAVSIAPAGAGVVPATGSGGADADAG